MNRNFNLLNKAICIGLDLLMLNLSFIFLKYYLLPVAPQEVHEVYRSLMIFLNIDWIVAASLYKLYRQDSITSVEVFVRRTIKSYIPFVVLVLLYLYYSHELITSRLFITALLVALPFGFLVNRSIYVLVWMQLKRRDYFIKRILIIGYNEISKKLAVYFERNNAHVKIVGFCEEPEKVFELSNYPIINTPGNAISASQKHSVTEIYSTILPEQDKRIYELMQLADQACIRFKIVADFSFLVNKPMHLKYYSGMAVLSSRPEPLDDIVNRFTKRLFDVAVSGIIVVAVLSWLMPLIALAIYIDSRGPIFFRQKRSGLNNKPFECLKFRSMHKNKDAHDRQAKKQDERFTTVGGFIRRTSMDELPQFFNVLKGDMSIVGPRPHMLKHTEIYSGLISKYMIRQMVKPGITGWAQINGHRGETRAIEDMQLRVDHDLWYMENWNVLLDLKITFLTAYNLLKGEKNAY